MTTRATILACAAVGALSAAGQASPAEGPGYPEHWVRLAAVAVAVYHEDHGGTFAGMTVARLREWVPVRNVRVVRATRSTFCIESRRNGLSAFWDGLGEPVKRGTCANAKAGRPLPPPKPKPRPPESRALNDIRGATLAIEAYYVDHVTYVGMTVANLRAMYDPAMPEVRIVRTGAESYCIEAGRNGETAHKTGPAAEIRPGHCPG